LNIFLFSSSNRSFLVLENLRRLEIICGWIGFLLGKFFWGLGGLPDLWGFLEFAGNFVF
jgi:hypothetical protein